MKDAIFDKMVQLEKMDMKGGWTYARLPGISMDTKNIFGWRRVKGTIDGYAISKYHIMSMGKGVLFLPVKLEIRKKIQKHVGDKVHIILFMDSDAVEIPEELLLCLQDEPKANAFFYKLTQSEQMHYIKWIFSAKRIETRANRLATAINKMEKGQKMYEMER
jgi:hypothetical protein